MGLAKKDNHVCPQYHSYITPSARPISGGIMVKNTKNSNLVYSTETGRICPCCSRPVAECQCRKNGYSKTRDSVQKGDRVRVSYTTKGRKGKGVTLITGLAMDNDELKALAKKIKQQCGSGGTVKQGNIEIQGDHRKTLSGKI